MPSDWFSLYISGWPRFQLTHYKCWTIEHFCKNKAFRLKQRQLNCCFLSLFYFLSVISTFVTNIISFIETLFRLRVFFISLRVLSAGILQNSLFQYNFDVNVANIVFVSHILLLWNSSFLLRLSELQGRFNLGQFIKIPKQKLESQLTAINPFSVIRVRWPC